eukprot:CAMPEP_0172473010 /NCGR_PEP_ID=MMETSP1065-20121228/68640_1 /TAXON_ID=265537 /ORGANISM="Amphiprora paludosa, Strain CCMP125" /LENGTH=469 /DNA_ID=CAMNT_0013231179 /DNA_START=48 /DNA_END=1457 /DNA_ORIENTATION=-
MNALEENGALKWDEYMTTCEAFLECGLPNFIEERLDLPSFPAFIVQSLREFGKAWPLKPHSDVLESIFESTKMRALASFQDLYVGLEPYRNDDQLGGGVFQSTAPAVFGLLAAIELHPSNNKCGVFAPIGGFDKVSAALENLCKDLGVSIKCNQTVTEVSDDGVTVVSDDSDKSQSVFIPADLVIVNADLPYAQKSLAPLSPSHDSISTTTLSTPTASERFDWNDKKRFSSGVIAFHWSIDKPLENLNTHNVFMQAGSDTDAIESWRRCIREQGSTAESLSRQQFSLRDACNFYVHRPVKVDSTAAPEGCDSILVLLPCPILSRQESLSKVERSIAMKGYAEQFDKSVIDSARALVLDRLSVVPGLDNLQNHILHETVDTPATMANAWNVGAGTPFGMSHGFRQLSRLRSTSLTEFPKALFVGASSRPGNGVPLVLVCAEQTANAALKALERLQLAQGQEEIASEKAAR